MSCIDLKTDNLDRVSIPRKIVALLMSNTRFMGPLMVPNDKPKSVNIDKISTALHVYYLNLIVDYLNTVQIAQIHAYNFECTPCSDAISGPMNRVFDIKSGHDFCRYRNSIQVIYFQINDQLLSVLVSKEISRA